MKTIDIVLELEEDSPKEWIQHFSDNDFTVDGIRYTREHVQARGPAIRRNVSRWMFQLIEDYFMYSNTNIDADGYIDDTHWDGGAAWNSPMRWEQDREAVTVEDWGMLLEPYDGRSSP
jgi:hypothetical protein